MANPEITERALAAIVARDWPALRPLLHPYLHWTEPDGAVVRGRSKVMALLDGGSTPAQPASVELRDCQIYRWRSTGDQTRDGMTTPIAGDTLGRPPTH